MDYQSYPILANVDCSPTADPFSCSTTFDRAPLADPVTWLDTPITTYDDYFSRPAFPADAANKSLHCTSNVAATELKRTENPTFVPPLFGQLNIFSPGFRFYTNPIASNAEFDPNPSPLSDDTQTPSLCGDAPQNAIELPPPPLSLWSELRCASTGSGFEFEYFPDPSSPPKRTCGRPRLARRSVSSLSSSSSAKAQRSQRLLHNQVERKYRESLNVSLERLRKSVPKLCEDKLGGTVSRPKPSKAMILEGAIEYIKEMEKERDIYRKVTESR